MRFHLVRSVVAVEGRRRALSLSLSLQRRNLSTANKETAVPAVNHAQLAENLKTARLALAKGSEVKAAATPLTLAEKLLLSHLHQPEQQIMNDLKSEIVRGKSYLNLMPDRVALQDASAQTAILQFMLTGLKTALVPTSIHCDHLIVASSKGAAADLENSVNNSREIFDFLHSASRKYGIDFWKPGSGIIHQIVLENYSAPGGLMIGCDSHTPNGGGLGMMCIGVGGADAVDVMTGTPWELASPKVMGIELTGKLNEWASPKDVIATLAGLLSVKGGTGHVIEYFGEGVETLSCTGMATICNMGAELGATTSVFPYMRAMGDYLKATGRADIAETLIPYQRDLLTADAGCEYDVVHLIDLSAIEPKFNGPFTPDLSTPLSQMSAKATANQWPEEVSAALIGSCTNSSYEDMTRAANIASQAVQRGLKVKSPLYVTPGSELIRKTCERDGILDVFEKAGGVILANACGPCIGQWDRSGEAAKDNGKSKAENSILTSFNRNFRNRNDGNPNTHNFLSSPELVTAMAFYGNLHSNPLKDPLVHPETNEKFYLDPPKGERLPVDGFDFPAVPCVDTTCDSEADVCIDPKSTRLQKLEPFSEWDGQDMHNLAVLMRVKGKCTTDHISAAGPWLKYKGHLENISQNTLITAVNAENDEVNSVYCAVNGSHGSVPEVAKTYKDNNISWIIVGDENYGEGSAREHAAMQPRFLGCRAVVCRSFARIHETNLKKQGILPLTFVDKDDYELIGSRDNVSILNLENLTPDSQLMLRVKHDSQDVDGVIPPESIIPVKHTLSETQIQWIKAGSALNRIAQEYDPGKARTSSRDGTLLHATSS
eukprot:Nk52_evm34s242 gene=Nk52_evmTU34s242